MNARKQRPGKRTRMRRRGRGSDGELVRVLRELEAALSNAIDDGIGTDHRAAALRSGCYRYISRLRSNWRELAWPISQVVDAINERRKPETRIQARDHIEQCLAYLQEAIAEDAAVLADDASLEERVTATIEVLAASARADDSSS